MEDKLQGRFTRIDQIQWSEQEAVTGWLKGMDFPVRLARQVFTRQLAFCILLVVIWTYSGKISLQSIRNGGKVFHKSLKSNAALAKSPARSLTI